MDRIKYAIIGAGVIGLSTAYHLSQLNDGDIAVFEQHDSFGQETSSRNSEVIHAGLYYPKDSLKSKLCISGNKLLYDFCEEEGIPYKKSGKLVVSTNEHEAKKIEEIYKNATSLGVPELKLLDKDQIKKIEPDIFAINALYSGTTGIIDSHGLMKHLHTKAEENGVMFAFESAVNSIKKTEEGYVLTYNNDEIMAEYVINAAGLNSDKLAEIAGFDIEKLSYKLHYCKGDYFALKDKPNILKHLVYPVPHEKGHGLGVHATLNLEGYVRFGPDTTYINKIDYNVSEEKRAEFFNAAKKYLPWIKEDMLVPDTAGIRPKLQGPDDEFKDFVIKEESDNDFPKFVNMIGLESPGLTAAVAVGGMVSLLF